MRPLAFDTDDTRWDPSSPIQGPRRGERRGRGIRLLFRPAVGLAGADRRLLQGLVIGGLTALIAFGIVLVYRANRIINLPRATWAACRPHSRFS